jgi:hypothetical protein
VSPDQGLSSGLFMPLAAVVIIYALLRAAGGAMSGRRGAALLDASFGVMLLGAVYVLVLLLYALASKFGLVSDMVIIVAILFGFFAILLVGLLGIFDLGIGGIARARARRRGEHAASADS